MRLQFRGALLVSLLVPCGLAATNTDVVETGHNLFLQKCAFCHGRDAGGGETGPDLTASELVKSDVKGDKIGNVVRNGRPDKGMPRFALPEGDIGALVGFIHKQAQIAASQSGGRKGVTVADLQTGNAQAGERYFNGEGGCSGCHSASGDLAHVASKYAGLKLELKMLYPEGATAKVTVKPQSGEAVIGKLAYLDEFTVALHDGAGGYHSWRTSDVAFTLDDPAEAHWKQLSKYSDDDIHNLFAYIQTLR